MPIAPNWYPRIPDAVAQLETLDRDLLTRTDLEVLLGVSRPRASQLLHRFHARPVGSQLVLDRLGLIRSLRAIRRGRPAKAAAARRTNVATTLRQARLEAVRVPVAREVLQTQVAGLPAGIALGPGHIEVRFESVSEALQKLFTLAQAIINDYDRFAAMVSANPTRTVGESTP
ncbi:MAG: hypothetical protein ABJA98_27975 [Acidobacteriota bacterium]